MQFSYQCYLVRTSLRQYINYDCKLSVLLQIIHSNYVNMSFVNKVIIITGGSAGIGAATAIHVTKEGADVVIVGRNEGRLSTVAEKCQEYGKKPLVIKADITKEHEAKNMIEQTIYKYGKLDVLVNNAGIIRESGVSDDTFLTIYDQTMNVNIRAVVFLTKLAVPYLIESKGNIVNVSSVAGSCISNIKFSAYRTSKAALNHFTRCMAKELAPFGIRVNTVSPGPTRTEIFDVAGLPGTMEKLAQSTVLQKISEPEEVADLISYLASDKARSITGSEYVIDNGMLLME